MSSYILDLEANGLYREATKIHCLVLRDIDDNAVLECADQLGYTPISTGLQWLTRADRIIGHNIIGYDIPLLEKLYGIRLDSSNLSDTLVLGRLAFPDLNDWDSKLLKTKRIPGTLYGQHKLDAWAYRLGYKPKVAIDDWSTWTPLTQERCVHDTEINKGLWELIQTKPLDPRAVENEHGAAAVCAEMERNGFPFDVAAASNLYARLSARRDHLANDLKIVFPEWEVDDGKPFTPKRDNSRLGYKAGVPVQKRKTVAFNPSSRQHIAYCLKSKYGWEPKERTDTGLPKIDEDTLAPLPFPEAKALYELLMLDKRIGQLAEGNKAWLKLEQNGRIHGGINPSGAWTSRASHSNPNLSQVTSSDKPYGKESRACFTAEPDMVLLGCDLSGIQLRALAHYLYPYDGGAYGKLVTTGDPHTSNMDALGLREIVGPKADPKEVRTRAKRWIYSRFFGAQEGMLGSIACGPAVPEPEQRRIGRLTMERFSANIVGMADLEKAMAAAAKRGYIVALDGRRIPVSQSRLILMALLQSAEACIAKKWLGLMRQPLWAKDVKFHVWSHDEVQMSVKPDTADYAGTQAVLLAAKAGEEFEFNCPVGAAYKIGANWAETH